MSGINSVGWEEGACRGTQLRAEHAMRQHGTPGLVPFSTSDTRGSGDSETVLIDTRAARLRRMKSGVMTATRLICGELDQTAERWRPWMITPTYRPGEVWKPTHITALVKCFRAWAERQGFRLRYVWVAEIQQRRYRAGAIPGECVHYHLLIWLPARLSPQSQTNKDGGRMDSLNVYGLTVHCGTSSSTPVRAIR